MHDLQKVQDPKMEIDCLLAFNPHVFVLKISSVLLMFQNRERPFEMMIGQQAAARAGGVWIHKYH